ncbi:GTP-binding protein [Cupriavidus basilensis]|uniref:GTP-binding protein n=1 Tax=Cupriavidus basilensis TaxID=68895 RepID=A0ABT6AYA9_9BURK|nr:GTP-binding protein [Cupriavidus basilensis]MDF3837605.1 GTP-binding protein [Cupriavidus basilensis]
MNLISATPPVAGKVPVDRIPVSLLTGFLGAGKTTLLNHWVHQQGMAGVAVLVNEFGEVGIDHHLVDAVSDRMLLLDSGCLCCNMQGDLVAALKSLFTRVARREIAPITRVVIETTGLADPVPVLYTLMEEPFVCARYVCAEVITAISATHGLEQLHEYAESRRQIMAADRVLITKCDQASTAELGRLEEELQSLNPQASRVQVRHGVADLGVLLSSTGVYGRTDLAPGLQAWLGAEIARQSEAAGGISGGEVPRSGRYLPQAHKRGRHSAHVHSFVITFDRPVPWFGFAVAMGQILRRHGAALLRAKGLMCVAGDAHPRVVQCVQDVAYPPVRLRAWPHERPFEDGRGRLVFIVRNLASAQIEAIRATFADLPSDIAALRASVADWELPTRCWLSQRVPMIASSTVQHDAWLIQPRHFRTLTNDR